MRERVHKFWIRRKVLVITVLVLAGSGVVLGAVRLSRRSPTVATLQVKRGEFLDSMQVRGEVKALKSVTISAPADAGDLQIVKIAAEGTVVKPGDVVVEFDRTKTEQDLAVFRSSLKSAQATIDQAKAQARQYAPAKGKVTVCEWEDGRLQIRYRDRAVSWDEIPGPSSSSCGNIRRAQGPETKAAHAQRGSLLAAGLSQVAPPGSSLEHRPCR